MASSIEILPNDHVISELYAVCHYFACGGSTEMSTVYHYYVFSR